MTDHKSSLSWHKSSWKDKKAVQICDYPDKKALENAQNKLSNFPPLVFAGEVELLEKELARACRGEAFLLQGGDCAERFSKAGATEVKNIFHLFLRMSLILTYGLKKPVIRVARIAGQYAKPRSSDTEKRGDKVLPSYRGDMVNGFEFDEVSRSPSPERMLEAYLYSASSLNLIRAFVSGGYADISNLIYSDFDFNVTNPGAFPKEYVSLLGNIKDALDFYCALDYKPEKSLPNFGRSNMYVSHEALHLPYEECLVRQDTITKRMAMIACSAHMLWIGEKTRAIDGAHVEFCRGIVNPIGVKCGPGITPDDVLRLADILNPSNKAGKLVLITRFGANKIEDNLPELIRAVSRHGKNVVWSCDPMHGNTFSTSSGIKTRAMDAIMKELELFFAIQRVEGGCAGGLHIEMTGDMVTECVGGEFCGISESNLTDNYDSACDPRLNANQSIELALKIAKDYSGGSHKLGYFNS